jgi:methionyl-tRNA synthetase
MSKSKGNVIYADELVSMFGVDAVRYFLLHEMPFDNDGVITWELMVERINSDLANTLGNLVNRTVSMTNKYFGGSVSKCAPDGEFDQSLIADAKATIEKYYELMDAYRNADAMDLIISFAKHCNKYIDETAPWVLAKSEDDKPRLEAVMYNLLESIRLIASLFEPAMPDCSKKIFEQLCNSETALEFGITNSFSVGAASPLFARIDTEKVLAELEEKRQAQIKEAEAEEARKNNLVTMEQIGIEDFMKVELRTAKIKACEPVKKAKKLLKLTLDDGSGEDRIVASGIAKWYKPEDLIGKTIVLVANLKPAVLCGVESNGMILAAEVAEDDVRVLFLEDMPAGCKVR